MAHLRIILLCLVGLCVRAQDLPFFAADTSGFDPSQVAGLWIRYDANTAGTNDGDLASTIFDSSGNGFNLVAQGTKRPVWTNSTSVNNNLGFVMFSRSGATGMSNIVAKASQPITIFMVFVPPNTVTFPNAEIYFDSTNSANPFAYYWTAGASDPGFNFLTTLGSHYSTNVPVNTAGSKHWRITASVWNGASSATKTNNITWASGDAGVGGINGITFAMNRLWGDSSDMWFAYGLWYTNVVSASDQTSICRWLTNRFGTADGLNSN